MLKIVSGG